MIETLEKANKRHPAEQVGGLAISTSNRLAIYGNKTVLYGPTQLHASRSCHLRSGSSDVLRITTSQLPNSIISNSDVGSSGLLQIYYQSASVMSLPAGIGFLEYT
ncbi:hypothetical protein NliqN6_6434 [Naganishia liquefaciens]|uniref:Uncharacterized protein n=1 Tax=Naganishia liquefaciens TaxID=104408 RepID=A0A8H3TZN5_9TREE|nr:hypothetical protein NliqN6_6434 [Naganishia liquefaciens]